MTSFFIRHSVLRICMLSLFGALCISLFFVGVPMVHADPSDPNAYGPAWSTSPDPGPQIGGSTGNPQIGGSSNGPQIGGSASIQNPLGNITSVAQFIQLLLQAVVKIGVPIAVLFVVLAGFKFITAQGNPEQLATARRNFIHVVIGIAIFIGAWALAQLILETLRQIGVNV